MRVCFELAAFAVRLTSLCAECGMSVAELAWRSDIPIRKIHCYMAGLAVPSAEEALRLAKVLNCSLDVLLGRVPLRLVA